MDPRSGRCAILFPHGVLFRVEERDMRKRIVAADLVEAIIGLGPNLFYNSPMEACIVICRSKKPADRAGKVLFIDALKEVTRERAQSFLTPEHIDRIAEAYRSFRDEKGFAAVATLNELRERDSNLSIPLYVRRATGQQIHDLDQDLTAWRMSSAELRDSVGALFVLLDSEVAS
jgi:type I restriction enzyme M protein